MACDLMKLFKCQSIMVADYDFWFWKLHKSILYIKWCLSNTKNVSYLWCYFQISFLLTYFEAWIFSRLLNESNAYWRWYAIAISWQCDKCICEAGSSYMPSNMPLAKRLNLQGYNVWQFPVICQAICPLSDVIMCQSICDMTVAVICQQDICPAL